MSNVWLTIPSARPGGGTVPLWIERGYKVAVWRDTDDLDLRGEGLVLAGEYPGYARAVNALVKEVLALDPQASWCVAGGDDTEPDPNHTPKEIAEQCGEHFGGTFGVMQPTGDRYADGCIDRICGSPWMGREFCKRMNGGEGPLWPEYKHMFVDEELQHAALKLGVLWQRPELIHFHRHFTRAGDSVDWSNVMPEFLREANSPQHWATYQSLFLARKAAGFPGHAPLIA